MRQQFASWCSCKMGDRTNTICSHRSGGMIALQAPWFFRHTVTQMFKVIDIWRHPNFQPVTTGGPPAGNRDRSVMTQAFPCRPRRSEDKRAASKRRYDTTFQSESTSTHQASPPRPPPPPPPQSAGINTSPTRLPTPSLGGGAAVNHPSGLAGLLNSNNCCYINAVVQILTCVVAQDEIDMLDPRLLNSPELLDVYETLYDLCQRRQYSSQPPFSTAPLRDCFNALYRVSSNVDRFQVGRFECAIELLQEVLTSICFNIQFFVDFPVVATCLNCNQQISEIVANNKMLEVAVPLGLVPFNVSDLFQTRMNDRQHFLDFVHCHCVCLPNCSRAAGCSSALRVQGHLSSTPGDVMIIKVERMSIGLGLPVNNKVLTPLSEPNQIQGYNLVAVMCHVEKTMVRGHWISFVKRTVGGQPTWWRLDDSRPVINSNPFNSQYDPTRQGTPTDFTIDILVFQR